MTNKERRFMEILKDNIAGSVINGHVDIPHEIVKTMNALEFEESCEEIDKQFEEDCKKMDAEYEASVARMREEYERKCSNLEKFGTFEDVDVSSKLDEMLKSF